MKQKKRVFSVFMAVLMLLWGLGADGGKVLNAKAETQTTTTSVEMTSTGLVTGTNYGTLGILGIYVLDDMGYKSATVTLEDGSSITGYVVGKNNPKPGKGDIAESGAAIKFVPEVDCSISLVVRTNPDKEFFFVTQTAEGTVSSVTEQEGTADGKEYRRLNYELKAGNIYYAYRNGSKASFAEISYTYAGAPGEPANVNMKEETSFWGDVIAFPGAEGGGMYATGGRGGDVYVVTTLEDYGKGENQIKGSLRYAIETAPDEGRIIVFHVGGTIHLKDTLSFSGKKNITIAGQTAPGEGITVGGADTNISDSQNLIIRFVHFRVGTENLLKGGDSLDALWGRDNDTFIIDHCSFSWSTDETLSTYRGKNGTVQWCIVSESLTVSGHSKGRHGYGAIWGGDNTVFQYNLIADHTSRNPRIGGGSMGDPTVDGSTATLQVSNNVTYNHGFYACYGGGYAYTNYVNNYLKTGPGTRDSILDTLIDYGENGKTGGVYLDGNILETESGIVTDNTKGVDISGDTEWVKKAYAAEAFDTVTLVSAAEAYDKVLAQAGVTYPRRDAIDARIVEHVENGEGYYINTQDEVGGFCAPEITREADFDTDMDGIPDSWESAHGLDPKSNLDSRKLNEEGYAWVEVYFNELVEAVVAADYAAENPTVAIDLENNTLVEEGQAVTVTASASANNGGSISRVEFYNGAQKVGEVKEAPYSYTFKELTDGTYYISARAFDDEGNATQSETSQLHINSTKGTGEWESTDIGAPGIKGTASYDESMDVITLKSAGRIGKSEGCKDTVDSVNKTDYADATSDDFHYVYQSMNGDCEIITRLDEYLVVDNHSFNGVMFREALTEDAAAVGLGLTMVKIENSTVWSAFMIDRDKKGGAMTTIGGSLDSAEAAEKAGIPMVQDLNFKEGNTYNGIWLKLIRRGNIFTGFVSEDAASWQEVGSMEVILPENVYVGLAVDAAKVANDIDNYATAKFSGTEINTEWVTLGYEVKDATVQGATEIAKGKDVVVRFGNIKGYKVPKSVEITSASGAEVKYDYDAKEGILTLHAVSENLTIKAAGEVRAIARVSYEEVDEADLLTVEEKDGVIILTQTATSGITAKDSKTAPVNQSFILFPETTTAQTLSMTLKITELVETKDPKNTGVFVGTFATESHAFTTLGLRAYKSDKNDSLSGYWTKADDYVGNGSPKFLTRTGISYDITFTTNEAGQFEVTFTTKDGNITAEKGNKKFKVGENFMQQTDKRRYGIGIIGASVEISNLVLKDHEGNEIYPGEGLMTMEELAASGISMEEVTPEATPTPTIPPVPGAEEAAKMHAEAASRMDWDVVFLVVVVIAGIGGYVYFRKKKNKKHVE